MYEYSKSAIKYTIQLIPYSFLYKINKTKPNKNLVKKMFKICVFTHIGSGTDTNKVNAIEIKEGKI